VYGSSVRGPSHRENGLPCQDAFAFKVIDTSRGVIVVADGLGSARLAETGASLVVEAAVEYWCAEQPPDPKFGVRAALTAARTALIAKAAELQCALHDLATTLMVVCFDHETVTVAHIGDGAVVCQTALGIELLSGPGASEYTNEVDPLTSDSWAELIRIDQMSGARAVAAFTDGCQRAGLRRIMKRPEPVAEFFEPLFKFVAELEPGQDGDSEIRELLECEKFQVNSEDDKTLVIATLTGRVDDVYAKGI